jgi:hypothetical protein
MTQNESTPAGRPVAPSLSEMIAAACAAMLVIVACVAILATHPPLLAEFIDGAPAFLVAVLTWPGLFAAAVVLFGGVVGVVGGVQ